LRKRDEETSSTGEAFENRGIGVSARRALAHFTKGGKEKDKRSPCNSECIKEGREKNLNWQTQLAYQWGNFKGGTEKGVLRVGWLW